MTRPLFDARALLALLAVGIAGPVLRLAFGPLGLTAYAVAATAVLPIVLASLGATLRAEAAGALFVFLTAASVENLDDVLGLDQRITLMIVAIGLVYLVQRRALARAFLQEPVVRLLVLFFLQEIVSAWLFDSDHVQQIVENRIAMLGSLLAGAALVRRPGGARLFAALAIVGALLSVPVMADEMMHPDLRLFSFSYQEGPIRAGGLFGQPNEVGNALAFAVALLLALGHRRELDGRAAGALGAAAGFGILACASRAALGIVLVVLGARAWAALSRRAGRAPVVTAALTFATMALVLPPLGRGAAHAAGWLADAGLDGAERLSEVLLAASGSPDELVDDDSSRLTIARVALTLIAERPVFGRGTGNFAVIGGHRSHVEFLEIAGENGVVGLGLYGLVLAAAVLTAWRVRNEERAGAAFVLAAWLMAHFDNHSIVEHRFLLLPVAYVLGLTPAAANPDAPAAPR